MKLFGFELIPQKKDETPVSFQPEIKDDGAVVVASGGSYGTYVDLEGTIKSEAELVTRYREMALAPEVESAIDDIVNEAIITDQDSVVTIDCDNIPKISEQVKKRIAAEFDEVLELLDFNNNAYEIFKKWYVDGRLYFHAIQDAHNPIQGLRELRYIDPRKIRKVREVEQIKDASSGATLVKTKSEYYVYSDTGFSAGSAATSYSSSQNNGTFAGQSGLRIAFDSIIHVTSGLMDQNNTLVLSYLHKAIKPLNQLRALEDATVIYRLSRAPERRVFYVDVGNLPKAKAEQYLRDMMVKHKNRLVYDAATGEIRDDRKYMTMLEDYWLPRRDGGKGTEIDVLPPGQNLGELTDVNYFLKKLMKSLGVPISRLDPESGMTLGRASEISRDEVKFSKFVGRMRKRFCGLLLKALEKQLVLKGVCTLEEWKEYSRHVVFNFQEDNHFAEMKDNEILQSRVDIATSLQQFVGSYFSHEWIRKQVLKQTDEDIAKMDEDIANEKHNENYQKLDQSGMMGGFPGDAGFGGMPPDLFGQQPGQVEVPGDGGMPENPMAGQSNPAKDDKDNSFLNK